MFPNISLWLGTWSVATTGSAVTLSVRLPVGAIIYLIMRKKLRAPVAPPPVTEQTVTDTYSGYYSPANVGQQTEGAKQTTTDQPSEEAGAESSSEGVNEENKSE